MSDFPSSCMIGYMAVSKDLDFFQWLEVMVHSRRTAGRDDTCWLWTGKLSPTGYGRVRLNHPSMPKKDTSSHRAAYMLHHQILDIPTQDAEGDRLEVSHLCHTPACVNPNHLTLEKATVNRERQMCAHSHECLGTHHPSCIL